ncbi:hypothetical protein ZIOFF_013053 [Zingiber officinale]|uniref:Legume lectin domain-containing protein n=1 Tax=Zingiber officinale TaxID=94328 RepID=A0A8J5LNP6_ZINOF|nr:hypothetical protein ZIOFF_013053 [Zingiber officinale]
MLSGFSVFSSCFLVLRVSAPSSSAHFVPRLGIFPMTTSSTASALILAIILLLVAPLSPGNCASTGEGNALFFSFGGSRKNRSFATEFALYGDAEMNSSEVRVTRAVNESSELMIYWKPVRFFGTKPGFSSSFSFSVSPGNGGGLAFFFSPVSVPLEPANGDWSRLSTSVVAVKFVTTASLVEVDVGRELLTKSSNLSDDGLLLILSRGENFHSWIDYGGESKRIEVRLCQDKDPKEAAPSISHSIDLSYMLWREASWVGLSSWSGNSSHGSSIYSWNFIEKRSDKMCCMMSFSYLQASLTNDATVSVNRCLWSPEGSILGVAFSKHLVQIYAFNLNEELRQHLEIDAHIGSVNDIAFSYPKKTLSIITCGDDKAIKVSKTMWFISQKIVQEELYVLNRFRCMMNRCGMIQLDRNSIHLKAMKPLFILVSLFLSVKFFFSTSTDGKIKAWSYEGLRSRVAYEAPGHWCTTMAYSADGTRLFSCGTSKDGDSHLVEWNETGTIKQTYNGFRKHSLGVVQFDITRNRFLVAGDEFQIKFWDMDNTDILTTTDANGGLPAFPHLRFQKDGSLLAITTSDNGIKILANADGQRVLRMLEVSHSVSKQSNSNVKAVVDSTRAADIKPRIPEETERIRSWKLTEIVNVGHLKTLRLPDSTSVWPCDERNPSGKSTASVAPQLRQPPNGENQTQGPPKKDNRLVFSPSLNVLVSAGADAQMLRLWKFPMQRLSDILKVNGCIQELQLNSSGIGDEGARVIADMLKENQTLRVLERNNNMIEYSGFARKITLLDIGNNEIDPKGAFSIAEFVKKTKSLLRLNLYMNDIGDAVWLLTIVALCSVASLLKHKLSFKFTNLKYSRVEIDEVRFEWAECMLDYI